MAMNDNGVVGELRAINGEKRTKYASLWIKNRARKDRKHSSYLLTYSSILTGLGLMHMRMKTSKTD
jgi:hypothetical protein